MKVKITLILSLILSLSAFGKEVEICESKGVPEIAGDEVNTIMSTMKALSDDEVKSITHKLCGNVKIASATGLNTDQFRNIILEALEVGPNTKNETKNEIISDFLNSNKQKLVCPKNNNKKDSRDLHVYKTAVLNGVIELYDEILLDDDEYEIDLNAYEIVDGKKETVVDYIEKQINTGLFDNSNLELLRDDIIDMGGKRGEEL